MQIGKKLTIKKISFTCSKSGKNLIWVKSKSALPAHQPLPTSTPTPAPTSTPTPSPSPVTLPTAFLSPTSAFAAASECALQDTSGTIFNLGFPRRTVIKNYSKVRVMVIRFAFSDTGSSAVGWDYTKKALADVTSYFSSQSYGKTTLDFSSLPIDAATGEPAVVVMNETFANSLLPAGQSEFVGKVLAQTSPALGLSKYDSVLVVSDDWRTLNAFGGQAWQQPPGWNLQPPQVGPFTSPSGDIESLVFSSNHSDVLTHELAHAILGYIDLYRLPDFSNTTYTQLWDIMDAAYTGDYGVLTWEKWLAGWIAPEQIHCIAKPGKYSHFLSYNELAPSAEWSAKMVVVKTTSSTAVVIEARGVPRYCIFANFCWGGSKQGVLAYTVDVTKLSAQGAIVMDAQTMAWPNLAEPDASVTIGSTTITVKSCDTTGCLVETVN